MVRTTPTSPVDLAVSFPEVLPFGRNAVRLHPRLGSPGASDSSMGGPLLWPAGEPWPSCPDSGHQVYGEAPVGPEPVALVPVVQMYARDVPDLPFPDGTDVCQVLWCPLDHPESGWSPRPQLFWRRAADVASPLTTVPGPRRFEKNYLPRPCVIDPERVVDYPNWDLPVNISAAIRPRAAEVEQATGWAYHYHLSCVDGVKAGGYPNWTQEPDWPDCPAGHRMEHLLSIPSWEFDGTSWKRWTPIEDRPPSGNPFDLPYEQRTLIQNPHGLTLGDAGGVYLFVCPRCPDLPMTHRHDCS